MKIFLTSVLWSSFLISSFSTHVVIVAGVALHRHAIEEELEVLYDAYYEELEQYANYQQRYASSGGTITPPPGPGPFPGSVELDKDGLVVGHGAGVKPNPPSQRGKTAPVANGPKKTHESEFDDDEGENEEYEEEEYEEEEDEEEEEEEEEVEADEDAVDGRTRAPRRAPPARERTPNTPNGTKVNGQTDDRQFGSSLTAAGPLNFSYSHHRRRGTKPHAYY